MYRMCLACRGWRVLPAEQWYAGLPVVTVYLRCSFCGGTGIVNDTALTSATSWPYAWTDDDGEAD